MPTHCKHTPTSGTMATTLELAASTCPRNAEHTNDNYFLKDSKNQGEILQRFCIIVGKIREIWSSNFPKILRDFAENPFQKIIIVGDSTTPPFSAFCISASDYFTAGPRGKYDRQVRIGADRDFKWSDCGDHAVVASSDQIGRNR